MNKANRDIRTRVLTNQRYRNYVECLYAVVSLAADSHFVGGHIVTSRVSVGSACVRVWKRDCDVTYLVEHRVKSLQKNGP